MKCACRNEGFDLIGWQPPRRDGRTDLFVTGVYLDRIRDEAGSLRFAERLVVCDSSHFDTLLAIPL